MNILTKVSIVVLVVLSLFACAVFITQASVVPNYYAKYNDANTRAEVNLMQANNAQVALLSAQQENQRQTGELKKVRDDAQTAAEDAQRNVLDLQGKLATALRDAANQKATTDLLAVQNGSLVDRVKVKDDELTGLRKSKDQMAEELRQMTQQYQETSAQLERSNKQSEYYQEKMAELQKQVEDIKARGTTVSSAAGSTERVAGPEDERYTGSITSVKGDMAEINIGTSNGVKKGDKLTVYRGAKFVAYLKIEQVDANYAAGIVTERQSDLAVNDKVTNKLQ